MERYLRNAAGLPELADDEMLQRRKEARMDEAARMAETQTRYLAARSQLVMAVAQEEAMAGGGATPESMAMEQQSAQGAQGLAQGQQQMDFAAANEQRTQQEHDFGQSNRLFQAIGGEDPTGGAQEREKKTVKKYLMPSGLVTDRRGPR